MRKLRLVLAVALSLFLAGMPVFATAFSSTAVAVNLSLSVGETLTVSATPASVVFTQSGSTATASGPITVVTSYNLAAGHPDLRTWAWLSSPTAALSNGTTNIPSSEVFASIDSGTPMACSITGPATITGAIAGATCPFIENVTNPAAGSGSFTDSVLLSLSGLPTLTPGSYTGVLNIQAEAN